ncbi:MULTISPECIES: hypothetical protein [Bacillaceae]|uniref:hypothetical protein n=1 Tax=Bacillaceae TaxID=186817 RepID=UPI000BFA5D91|nr:MULTISPECIES: hypothetical protein [Bacillaceae]MCA0147674.1 hypothetical protein [Rossellomorea vietnamensis]PFG05773.1 hypothetical protein ATG71_2612 [Bacillus sp. es.034]
MGCYRNNDNVGGASDRCRNNDVAGASDNNDFRVPVRAYIRGEDFCRAVRRCRENDVAGEMDNRRRCRCRWF